MRYRPVIRMKERAWRNGPVRRLSPGLFGIALTLLLLLPAAVRADPVPQPVIKHGRCPSGYHVSGDYCVSGSRARTAIPKSGRCPRGWTVSGDYCLERR